MKMICERCGRSFPAAPNCPHCGALIETQDGDWDREVRPVWGWATISLNATDALRESSLRELKKAWGRLEEFSVMRLLDSQVGVFDKGRADMRVLVKQDLLVGLIDGIRATYPQVSMAFEPVDGDFGEAAALNALLASRSAG